MSVTVQTVFFAGPIEVEADEAAALKAQGLLRDGPPPADVPEPDVEVVPVFTGVPVKVPASEAAVLRGQGLLIEKPAAKPAATPPGPADTKET